MSNFFHGFVCVPSSLCYILEAVGSGHCSAVVCCLGLRNMWIPYKQYLKMKLCLK